MIPPLNLVKSPTHVFTNLGASLWVSLLLEAQGNQCLQILNQQQLNHYSLLTPWIAPILRKADLYCCTDPKTTPWKVLPNFRHANLTFEVLGSLHRKRNCFVGELVPLAIQQQPGLKIIFLAGIRQPQVNSGRGLVLHVWREVSEVDQPSAKSGLGNRIHLPMSLQYELCAAYICISVSPCHP